MKAFHVVNTSTLTERMTRRRNRGQTTASKNPRVIHHQDRHLGFHNQIVVPTKVSGR